MLGRKRAGKQQQQESSKKQKMEEDKESDEVKEVSEYDKGELLKHLVIKKDEDIAIDAIPLATKLLVIVDYKLLKEGIIVHFQLIRAYGSSKRYSSMIRMLQGINREDLLTLWKLVKTKHGNIRPEDDHERVMWGDFKVMFESDIRSKVWIDLQGYTVSVWKLYDSCGVHFASLDLLVHQGLDLKVSMVCDMDKSSRSTTGFQRQTEWMSLAALDISAKYPGLRYDAATAASPVVESFVNLSDKSGSNKGYDSVPPPITRNFIPRKPDLTFIDKIVESKNLDVTTVVTPCNDKTNSDDESEIDYTVKPTTEKIKSVKTVRETNDPKQNKQHPKGKQRNWNNLMSQRLGSDFKMTNKACYVCGSFEHLHYVCDKKVVRPVWNNSRRVNHKNFTNKMTHPHPKRSFVPQAVLTKSGKLSTAGAAVNTVRSVNTAASKPIVNHPRTKTNAFKRGYSQSSRPFNRHFANKNSIINTNVNTARVKHTTARDRAVVSKNKGKGANAVKASACWVWKAKNNSNQQQKEYKEKAVIDNGCSRHMTENKCYLDEYEDYDGGFVSFGNGKGRISGKGPKDCEGDAGMKPTEVDENEALDKNEKTCNIKHK
ncbi:hypothetical protein Tco_1058839, partial [Tanacetum coccineum]